MIKVEKELLIDLKHKEAIVPLTEEQLTILKEIKRHKRYFKNIEWRFQIIPLPEKVSYYKRRKIKKKPKKPTTKPKASGHNYGFKK